MSPKVLIAMSGGVDSTAAALKLLEQGYALIGCTFVTRYTSPSSIEAAQRLAAQLGIEHHVVDYSDVFEQTIVDYFVSEYQAGRTPNPCVLCNRLIKFGALAEEADKYGCDFIATGHYARIVSGSPSAEGGLPVPLGRSANAVVCQPQAINKYIACATDLSKDQSYFLWQVDPAILPRVLFPLGEWTKTQVREYLADKGFTLLSKQGESQDICFIASDYRTFLRERLGDGYKDYMSFTIGQRKGLGVALGYPAFVTSIGTSGVEYRGDGCIEHPLVPGVYLGHHDDLYATELQLRDVLFRGDIHRPVMAKIRYRSPAAEATITYQTLNTACGGTPPPDTKHQTPIVTLSFTQPVWAPTPGQSCVLYQDDYVVGGGIIL